MCLTLCGCLGDVKLFYSPCALKLCTFLSVCLFISSIVVIFVTTTHHSYTNIEHPLYVKKMLDGKDGAIKKRKKKT